MDGATGRYEKRLIDLAGVYHDIEAFDAACAADRVRIVYSVREVRPSAERGDLVFGTTYMEPGRVGDEYFVTRGHIHARTNRPETYYGESGEGLMLLESPAGETEIVEIGPRVIVYVPPLWIHRSVNVGSSPLVMSFCYPADAGQDYEIIDRSGGMATRIVAGYGGWKAIPNPSYRPRSQTEVDAIFAARD
jgi:glucose-6-phosphate isomerase